MRLNIGYEGGEFIAERDDGWQVWMKQVRNAVYAKVFNHKLPRQRGRRRSFLIAVYVQECRLNRQSERGAMCAAGGEELAAWVDATIKPVCQRINAQAGQ
tara:strand:+ start:1006 stop:1305 length:300 start_codon:yes stop_codon:yes gene_type:complete